MRSDSVDTSTGDFASRPTGLVHRGVVGHDGHDFLEELVGFSVQTASGLDNCQRRSSAAIQTMPVDSGLPGIAQDLVRSS